MKKLDKRDGTLMAGMAFTHKEKWGLFAPRWLVIPLITVTVW